MYNKHVRQKQFSILSPKMAAAVSNLEPLRCKTFGLPFGSKLSVKVLKSIRSNSSTGSPVLLDQGASIRLRSSINIQKVCTDQEGFFLFFQFSLLLTNQWQIGSRNRLNYDKAYIVCLGSEPRRWSMKGSDNSTELWRPLRSNIDVLIWT